MTNSESTPADKASADTVPENSVPVDSPASAEDVTAVVKHVELVPSLLPAAVLTLPDVSADATTSYAPRSLEVPEPEDQLFTAPDTLPVMLAGSSIDEAMTREIRGLTWWQSSAAILIAFLGIVTPVSIRRRINHDEDQISQLKLTKRST